MTIPTIDYDVLTSTPDERTAIDHLNAALLEVEGLKDDGHPDAAKLIADFEAWYGALAERQSHWVVPGVVKSHRVDQADVSEAQRKLYAIKTILGKVLPGDVAPPNVLPPEQQAKDLGDEIGDAAKATGEAAKTGIFALLALGTAAIIYKLIS
jgi:hypothetical protein